MEQSAGNRFTVLELKKALRERGLTTSGTKAEMIRRLEEDDPRVWEDLAARREAASRDAGDPSDLGDAPPLGENDDGASRSDGGAGGGGTSRDGEATERGGVANNGDLAREGDDGIAAFGAEERDDAMRELMFLRRERELWEREQRLLRRELDMLRNSPATASGTASAVTSAAMSGGAMPGGVRGLRELLPEFSGADSDFWRWKQQLELLKQTYRLDENSTRVLISSRLRGRALSWFHSKAEYLTLDSVELLREMGQMFDLRPGKLALRREFESRVWEGGESFCDYYHDKMILANRIPIADDEILDYLIEGVTDQRLQNQARLMNYRTGAELLKAFEKVQPERRRPSDTKGRKEGAKSAGGGGPREPPTGKEQVCYRCRETGHIAARCTRGREKRTCYVCGSAEHLARECSKRGRPSPSGAPGESARAISAIYERTVEPPTPYMVRVKIATTGPGGARDYAVEAIIDSGSPISLVRSDVIPGESREERVSRFCGLNGSPLRVDGVVDGTLEVSGVRIGMRFYAVPSDTMAYSVLLGRDFLNCPHLCVTLGRNFRITGVEEARAIDRLMHLEYEGFARPGEELQINPAIGGDMLSRIRKAYESSYLENLRGENHAPDFTMALALKHEQPISFRPRRLSFADKEALRGILDDLLKRAIIKESCSPYASPIVLTRKKDGGHRLCVDYRELNKITIRDNFPTELIDDNIDRLRGKKYFTVLDLKDGFHHVRMHEASTKYTSFVTPLGQFEYLRMPFGLTNAPRVFQRYIHSVFAPLTRDNKLLIYLDDLLVATEDMDEHIDILTRVFEIAGRHRLQFRLDKCHFAQSEIKYLGYCVNRHGIRPSDENIESVLNYPIPCNSKDLQRFIGLASYFRRFIPGFSMVAKPLYDVMKASANFKFESGENSAFEALKRHLASKPVLAVYSPLAETELHCDASASGFGAILLQKQGDNTWRPVSFWSQRTTPAESRYHSFELECLAAVT
ncbi:PREDICTED: uncharacterized protein LOC105557370 [Vollenhovia emeryi]|uniref:uncharacterized protein LOC105557370 n=1 Tax=Vollenhovia emeryi TaxID=411798 RepID=UPI0005F42141|nr:PREDICTED: uncharacterized protein LOC105557370 [Vollenhovia emeryi]